MVELLKDKEKSLSYINSVVKKTKNKKLNWIPFSGFYGDNFPAIKELQEMHTWNNSYVDSSIRKDNSYFSETENTYLILLSILRVDSSEVSDDNYEYYTTFYEKFSYYQLVAITKYDNSSGLIINNITELQSHLVRLYNLIIRELSGPLFIEDLLEKDLSEE